MTDDAKTIEATLFADTPTAASNGDALLAQYRIFVDTSEALVLRRQGVNNFFLSVNSLVLAGAGIILRDGDASRIEALVLVALAFGGVSLCFVWRRLITSFQQLSRGKFDVIHQLERRLPARMFAAEWAALGEGRDPTKYRPFTRVEATTPWVFGIVQVLLLIVGLYVFGSGPLSPRGGG